MYPLKHNSLVVALSAAGVGFILLGLVALALPATQEGVFVGQLDRSHALYLMDIAGIFTLVLGITLTWLGGKFWTRRLRG